MTWRRAAERRRRRFEREERELPARMRRAKRSYVVVFVAVMVLGIGAALVNIWRRGDYVMLLSLVGMIVVAAALARGMTRSKKERREPEPESARRQENP